MSLGRFEELRALMGSDYADLLRTAQADCERAASGLAAGIEADDAARLARHSHDAVSVAALLGAAEVAATARRAEIAARAGAAEAAGLAGELRGALGQLETRLAAELRRALP